MAMEPARDYELRALFTYVIEVLARLGNPYKLGGTDLRPRVPSRDRRGHQGRGDAGSSSWLGHGYTWMPTPPGWLARGSAGI
jgi:hypothetical protein